jgi:hypothetical protein
VSNKLVGELVQRLFHARTNAHVLHLATRSYAQHMALNTFYDDIIPIADQLAETYQGDYGLLSTTPLPYKQHDVPLDMLSELSGWIESNREEFWDEDDSYLDNILDEAVALIRQTQYKLRFLS